jgi:NAD(P)-dependent dehydrogenase (short-subunit alcohol dehydrogenase family)
VEARILILPGVCPVLSKMLLLFLWVVSLTTSGLLYEIQVTKSRTMARISITGSADGLGQLAANLLIGQGHQVVLHARNAERGREALLNVPNAEDVLTADSGMHMQGNPNLDNLSYDTGRYGYADSKLHVVLLSKAVARKWPGVYSNAVDPGWVPTQSRCPRQPAKRCGDTAMAGR